ncbi:MAG: FxsA family protein [Acidimicrobiales bacterium]|nr:FxsA family protein [Acidimicrobiales bacterium]
MLIFLVVAFLAVPIVEIYLIVEVARYAGILNTVVLLILVSVAGAWMVRREGLGILRRAQEELATGRVPGRQVVDGLLVLVAGALMLTPGFATDALGLALLFPPSRIAVREVLIRRFARRVNLG